jgi:acetyl esterase/lipase
MSNEFGWQGLLGDRAGTEDVSIHEAPGSADLFRDEAVSFASTIWACGGSAGLQVWPGGYHGFEQMAPTSNLAITVVAAIAARKRWLDRLLTFLFLQR